MLLKVTLWVMAWFVVGVWLFFSEEDGQLALASSSACCGEAVCMVLMNAP